MKNVDEQIEAIAKERQQKYGMRGDASFRDRVNGYKLLLSSGVNSVDDIRAFEGLMPLGEVNEA